MDEEVAGRVVGATVAAFVQPHIRRQSAEQIAVYALRHLNTFAKSYAGQPKSKWELRARKEAIAAVVSLPDGATSADMTDVALGAVDAINHEFEHSDKISKLTTYLPRALSQLLPLASSEKLETARKAVESAYAELPVGAGDLALESARNAALQPFLAEEREARLSKDAADAKSRLEFEADYVHLARVAPYLAELEASPDGWDFEGQRLKYAEKIKQEIRATLLQDLPLDPGAGRARVEELVNEWLQLQTTNRTS